MPTLTAHRVKGNDADIILKYSGNYLAEELTETEAEHLHQELSEALNADEPELHQVD